MGQVFPVEWSQLENEDNKIMERTKNIRIKKVKQKGRIKTRKKQRY
jgi:hypothetical protein